MTTTNLADFGSRELNKLKDLISAMEEQGLPKDFCSDGVTPTMNTYSGNVYLVNDEYQVAMLNGDDLESWYYLSYHGNEGFAEDLYFDFENGNIGEEDFEQLADILETNGLDDEAEEVRKVIDGEFEEEEEDEE